MRRYVLPCFILGVGFIAAASIHDMPLGFVAGALWWLAALECYFASPDHPEREDTDAKEADDGP